MPLKHPSVVRTRIARISLPLVLGASALIVPAAWAAGSWNTQAETLSTHPTWIYTPATAMAGGKRALLVVLHGCDQNNDQLKQWGNLPAAAEAKGAIVAVPGVGSKPWPLFPSTKCWDYDGARDGSGHVANLVALTKTLVERQGLNIDPRHVYISGMSSGASVAMLAACKAPEVIAGVGIVAGPSVGSDQMQAIKVEAEISYTADAALAKCKALAGADKLQHFNTQIANITYGEKDKNAELPGCAFSAGATNCPGTFQLVSKKWSTINAEMFRKLYGGSALGTAVKVSNNATPEAEFMGEHRESKVADLDALSLTRIYNVGHAWPAGSGQENDVNKGGVWMAQKGMNYAQYALSWLIDNNRRPKADGNQAPVIEWCKVEAAGTSGFTVSAAAKDSDGVISAYQVAYTGPKSFNESTGSGASLSKTYTPGASGRYEVTVSATDNANASSAVCKASVSIGEPVVILPPPGNIAAASVTTNSVSLTWMGVTGASGYHVYRNGVKVTSAPVTTLSFTNTGLEAATTYQYAVSTVNAAGEGERSNPPISVTTKPQDGWKCTVHYSSNYTHVLQGRAYNALGFAKANGSNQTIGLYTIFNYALLAQTKPGYYVIGACPQ